MIQASSISSYSKLKSLKTSARGAGTVQTRRHRVSGKGELKKQGGVLDSTITSLLQSTAGRRPPPYRGVLPIVTTLGWRPQCMLSYNVVFPDKPLIAFYDTHGRKVGDGILLCRHHTADRRQ